MSSLVAIVDLALETADTVAESQHADRILDAAMSHVAGFGFAGTTMDAVAKRAGVGRMTVYRTFGSKEVMLAALIRREGARILAEVALAAAAAPDVTGRLVEAFVATMRQTRRHPLLVRLRTIEPDTALELFAADSTGLIADVCRIVAAEITRGVALGEIGPLDTSQAAELLVRIAASFVLLPSATIDLDDDDATRRFAQTLLAPIITGRQPAAPAESPALATS